MADNTKIEWTTHTFNPWRGCTKVSPGCANCYAETLSGRNPKTLGVWGPNGTRVVAAQAMWKLPLKWEREAAAAYDDWHAHGMDEGPPPERPRVFCASLADVFEDWQGPMHESNGENWWIGKDVKRIGGMDDARLRLFALIDATPNLDWLLVTKRPENVLRMTYDAWCKKVPGHVSQNEGDGRHWDWPKNVWLGTSIENQAAADERIPHLLAVPAAVRFLSVEPLLGPVDLCRWLPAGRANWQCQKCKGFQKTYEQCQHCKADREYLTGSHVANKRIPNGWENRQPIDWVIVGGESGHGARPCDVAWIRSIVQQCKAAGVPCFVKQMGSRCLQEPAGGDANHPHYNPFGWRDEFRGLSHHGGWLHTADRKGGDMAEWSEDIRVREFPVQG